MSKARCMPVLSAAILLRCNSPDPQGLGAERRGDWVSQKRIEMMSSRLERRRVSHTHELSCTERVLMAISGFTKTCVERPYNSTRVRVELYGRARRLTSPAQAAGW